MNRAPASKGRNAAVVTLPLAGLLVLWLAWAPPSPDLAAAVYRAHLVSLDGFTLWDDNWYAGHYLPAYSLLFPALTLFIGLQGTGILAVTLSTFCFSRLAAMRFGARATRATLLFAVSATGDLFIGRITFATGVSFALLALLAETKRRHVLAALAAIACAAASPVAGLFLALVAAADLITHYRWTRVVLLGVPALTLIGSMVVLFPEGGQEPFGFLSLLAACGAALALLILLPRTEVALRRGAWLYVGVLWLCYAVPSPMGSNSVRLGVLFAPAIFAGTINVEQVAVALTGLRRRLAGRLGEPPALNPTVARIIFATILLWLVLWEVNGPVVQSLEASADPSTRVSYYTPVIRFLESKSHGEPMRIEVPFTSSHWDAAILARRFALARGWERQLDTRDDALFYSGELTASSYHAWLSRTAVRFVALSDAPLDYSSRQEAGLIRGGLPFLHEVFASRHWRVYEVAGAMPLASGPGRLLAMGDDAFTLSATHAGGFLVRIHYTPYWQVISGEGTISETSDGWTYVNCPRQEKLTVEASFSLTW
ncbi:MAG TPA: hypothetical protein VIC05_03750 [Solirubrobacteraceae bacterium]